MSDDETLAFYAREAARYRERFTPAAPDRDLRAFLDALPAEAAVLDLGCGPGGSAALMAQAGHRVTATDAVAEMVALAAEVPGVTARVARFDELDSEAEFDGVWANFSLLHAPRAELPANLARIHRALRPGGLFHLGLKTGAGAGRDALGRLYVYYSGVEIDTALDAAGFRVIAARTGTAEGLAGHAEPFAIHLARRD